MKLLWKNLFILFIQIESITKQIDNLDIAISHLKHIVSDGQLLNEQQIAALCNHEINRARLYSDLQKLRLGKDGHFVRRVLVYLVFNIQNASIVLVIEVLLVKMLVFKVLLVRMLVFKVLLFKMLVFKVLLVQMLVFKVLLVRMLVFKVLLFKMLVFKVLLFKMPIIKVLVKVELFFSCSSFLFLWSFLLSEYMFI